MLRSGKIPGMESPRGLASRSGFYLAMALAFLALVAAFFMPVTGVLQSVFYLAIAWGIRRRQWWAALTGALQLLSALGLSALHGGMAQPVPFAIVALFAVACAYVFARAALDLKGSEGASRVAWPWLAVLGGMGLFALCFSGYSMASASMEKTLLMGDTLLVERAGMHLGRLPRRDELLVF